MQKQRRRSASTADQHLKLRYIESKIPLLPKSKISGMVGNSEERFCHDMACLSSEGT